MALQRLRQLYGTTFGVCPGTTWRWSATLPVAGKGYIERLYLHGGGYSALGNSLTFSFNMLDTVPTTTAELDVGEMMFPYVGSPGAAPGYFTITADGSPAIIRGPFWFEPNGRRFAVGVYNNGANSMWPSMQIVWRPSDGEQSDEPLRRVGDR